jgi:hypothetical protein
LRKNYLPQFLLLLYLSLSTFIVFKNTKQTYGVNDDVIIQNWLSGFYTGSPEFMIRGSATPRIGFGLVISNLYQLMPSINWYSLILLALVLFSWYLLGLLAIRSKNFIVCATYIVVSFLHLLWFIPSPTYTASSVIISFAIIIFALRKISENEISKNFIILSLVYVFGFLIRPESFLLGTIVTLPFIVFAVIKSREIFRNNIKILLMSIITIVSIIGVDVIFERVYYQNNQSWIEYRDWEASRYKIQANAPEKALLENPEKFGWTMAEAEVFKSYNAIDSTYFSAIKLDDLIDESQTSLNINFDFISKSHQQIFDSDINWEWKHLISLISSIFLIFLVFSLPKSYEFLLLSISSIGIIYFVMLYVAGFLRQPERVQVSVIFLCILLSWASFLFSQKEVLQNHLNQFSILGWLIYVLVLSSTFSQASYLTNKVAGASNAFWLTQGRYLNDFPKDSIFVGNASQFRNNWTSPYKLERFEVEKRIMSFGWHNFSPHWVKRAQNLGLNSDNMFKSVIEDQRVFWISDPESMEHIVKFMKEQKYEFVGPEVVGELDYVGNEYTVWNFDLSD